MCSPDTISMIDKGGAPVLILFAKCPVPGRVKTRLMPQLSAEQAAQVATQLIEQSVHLAVQAWPGPVWLLTWPNTDHELFRALSRDTRIQLGNQSPGNLGEKMHNAMGKFTEKETAAAIMGCDVPHCPLDTLRTAGDLLQQGLNVIGPSTDGGYYFIGLQQCRSKLFEGIKWGGDNVLQATLAAARGLNIEFNQLPALRDIDSFEDLTHVFPDENWGAINPAGRMHRICSNSVGSTEEAKTKNPQSGRIQ